MPPSLDELRRRRDDIAAIAQRRGVTKVYVFGSVARGEAEDDGDVDFLVEFEAGRSLLDQVHLIEELSQLLHVPVDVVARGGLLERDAYILDEAVPL